MCTHSRQHEVRLGLNGYWPAHLTDIGWVSACTLWTHHRQQKALSSTHYLIIENEYLPFYFWRGSPTVVGMTHFFMLHCQKELTHRFLHWLMSLPCGSLLGAFWNCCVSFCAKYLNPIMHQWWASFTESGQALNQHNIWTVETFEMLHFTRKNTSVITERICPKMAVAEVSQVSQVFHMS